MASAGISLPSSEAQSAACVGLANHRASASGVRRRIEAMTG